MPYAATADLVALLGRDITAEEVDKADKCLELVDVAIDAHLDGRTSTVAATNAVATLAARRLFLNPDGVRNEVLGDWQTAYAPNELLSADERRLLDNTATGRGRARAGSPRIIADVWDETQFLA